MKLKTFTAQTMAQALAQVRKELGKDAMILHTRSYRVGAWFGIGRKNMVEITASSPNNAKSKTQPTRMTPKVVQKETTTARSTGSEIKPGQQVEPMMVQSREPAPEMVIQRGRSVTRQRLAHTNTSSAVQTLTHPGQDRESLNHDLGGGDQAPSKPVHPSANPSDRMGLDGRDALFADDDQGKSKPSSPTIGSRSNPRRAGARSSKNKLKSNRAQIDPRAQIESSLEHRISPQGSEMNEPPMISVPRTSNDDLAHPSKRESEHVQSKNGPSQPKSDSSSADQTTDGQTNAELREQLESLQKMMGHVLESTRKTAVVVGSSNPEAALPSGQLPAPLFDLYAKMIDNDVPVDLADRMVGTVRDRLDALELQDPAVVRQALLREIESTIRTRSESLLHLDLALATDRPRIIALVGPTGVGKTTTVAKLAATYKLRHGKKVGLITSDTYRIAAVDQLRTYAGIIDLPLKVANTAQEMSDAIDELSDCDIVVIDTAGRSQNDARRLDELAEFTKSANPDETHLVLSSTVGDNVLRKTAQRFKALGPDRCILTKLDEAVTTGTIAGMCDRIGLPLSFVTVGQEVPDDIEPARVDRLARCVIDGPEAVVRRWNEEIG